MRRLYPILLIVVLFAGELMYGAPAGATAAGGVDPKIIDQTRKSLQQTKQREQQMRSVLSRSQRDLNKIQSNLNRISSQLQTAEAKAADVRAELKRVEAELLVLEEKLESRRNLLRDRVNLLYRYGPLSYLELLFSATSFGDLISRYEMSTYFVRQDLKLLEEFRATSHEIEAKRKELEERHEELRARSQAITALKNKVASERQRQAERVKMTQAEVAKIQADRVRLEEALEELERLSRELGSEIRRRGSGAALGTGKMMWPVLGRVTSSFGWRNHPVLGKKKFHSGLDIGVPKGTPVLAADTGIVLISGWNGGYGYLVVIDHGRNITTFYGHNSTLLVKVGDVVVKGQRIALAGSTGLSTGPHVHFEVRVNGDPVNPLTYLNN